MVFDKDMNRAVDLHQSAEGEEDGEESEAKLAASGAAEEGSGTAMAAGVATAAVAAAEEPGAEQLLGVG